MAKSKDRTAVAVTVPNVQKLIALTTLAVSVTNEDSRVAATQHLADIAIAQKHLVSDIAALKKPHKDAIADIDKMTKPYKDGLDQKRDQISSAISAYKRRIEAKVEQSNTKKVEQHEQRVFDKEADAIAKGKPLPAIPPPALKSAPPKTEQVNGARVTEMVVKTWKLAKNLSEGPIEITYQKNLEYGLGIPPEYFVLDTARIGKLMKHDAVIQGIEPLTDTTHQVVEQAP